MYSQQPVESVIITAEIGDSHFFAFRVIHPDALHSAPGAQVWYCILFTDTLWSRGAA